jgi:hypothetical protein
MPQGTCSANEATLSPDKMSAVLLPEISRQSHSVSRVSSVSSAAMPSHEARTFMSVAYSASEQLPAPVPTHRGPTPTFTHYHGRQSPCQLTHATHLAVLHSIPLQGSRSILSQHHGALALAYWRRVAIHGWSLTGGFTSSIYSKSSLTTYSLHRDLARVAHICLPIPRPDASTH